ncbi:hypothetical protein [Limisphaera sp. VF-2]|uniref:hypothetical protein n=1 Tax=Limisphaera sp. VF-2 TaxID=3400418 RepID=UPI003C1CE830
MKTNDSDDIALRQLLRAARPEGTLPPGFAAAVWRRIEQTEATSAGAWATWLMEAAGFLCEPRRALALLGGIALLGAVTGLVLGWQQSEELARQRYLAAVSPLSPWP